MQEGWQPFLDSMWWLKKALLIAVMLQSAHLHVITFDEVDYLFGKEFCGLQYQDESQKRGEGLAEKPKDLTESRKVYFNFWKTRGHSSSCDSEESPEKIEEATLGER